MALVDINWRPTPRELRKFGVTMIIGFAIFAGLAYWRDHPTLAVVFLAIGGGAGLLGLTGTRLALLVYLPWMALAFVMGNIMSRVLVALFFYGMITPMGVVMRLFGRDKLQRKNRRSSTWDDLPRSSDRARYERQF